MDSIRFGLPINTHVHVNMCQETRETALKKIDFITKHTVGVLQISIPLCVQVTLEIKF